MRDYLHHASVEKLDQAVCRFAAGLPLKNKLLIRFLLWDIQQRDRTRIHGDTAIVLFDIVLFNIVLFNIASSTTWAAMLFIQPGSNTQNGLFYRLRGFEVG